MSRAESRQLRGSSLLLAGRILAVGVNFVTQVVIVRSLSKGDFGVFAYALSIVNLAETAATLGLDRAIPRLLPMYEERRQRERFLGTLVFVPAAVCGLGLLAVTVIVLARHSIAGGVSDTATAAAVVGILAALAPLQALDNLLLGVFAVFSRPGAIFLRRYVVAPGLRLAVVLALAAANEDVRFLAGGYVIAGGAGLLLYVALLGRLLRNEGVLPRQPGDHVEIPYREILTFTLPLLTTDLVFVLIESTDAILLGAFKGAPAVAALRAVQPLARMNQLVLASFGVLFTPLAARHVARDDAAAVRALYWRTAVWVAVVSFPIAVVTIAAAGPIAVTVFGSRYEGSGALLAVLSLGYYANAAVGFNGLTLNVFGRVRAVVAANVAAALLNVALNLALIPLWGAAGAATATASTLALQNVMRQLALRRGTGVPAFEPAYTRTYASIVVAIAAVAATCWLLDLAVVPALALCAVASIAVLAVSRHDLQIGDAFPELARLPVVGAFLAGRR